MEPQYVVALIITGLGAVAWFMIRNWAKNWETKLAAHDRRLDIHDKRHESHEVNHGVIKTRLDNIKDKVDETSTDVKELLRQSNGRRTTGG
jgi:hypothetical protein